MESRSGFVFPERGFAYSITMKRNTILTVAGTLISVASLALAGVRLYRQYKALDCDSDAKAKQNKLDDRLDDTFPASDATAVY